MKGLEITIIIFLFVFASAFCVYLYKNKKWH